jgi:hypothetical protein
MKTKHLVSLLGTLALLCSCIPSVNPYYTPKDAVFDARLLGTWRERDAQGQPQIWEFKHGRGKSCELTVIEPPGKRGQFTAQLFALKREQFLDIQPTGSAYPPDQAGLVGAAMFPGHLLLRVTQLEPELKLAACDYDWLEKFLEQNPRALAHRRDNNRTLLVADTRDLQRFVLKHINELFKQPGVMIREDGE